MRNKRPNLDPPRIDLIPLMDSMFLILVFFIFAMLTMVVHQGVPLNLPKAVSAITNQDDFTTLSVTPTGTVFFNDQEMSVANLSQKLDQLLLQTPNPKVYVASDKAAPFGDVLSILDLCRQKGISEVSFETETGYQ